VIVPVPLMIVKLSNAVVSLKIKTVEELLTFPSVDTPDDVPKIFVFTANLD
jgi:hypothetical protein